MGSPAPPRSTPRCLSLSCGSTARVGVPLVQRSPPPPGVVRSLDGGVLVRSSSVPRSRVCCRRSSSRDLLRRVPAAVVLVPPRDERDERHRAAVPSLSLSGARARALARSPVAARAETVEMTWRIRIERLKHENVTVSRSPVAARAETVEMTWRIRVERLKHEHVTVSRSPVAARVLRAVRLVRRPALEARFETKSRASITALY